MFVTYIGNDKAILKYKPIQNKKLTNLRVTTLENSSHDPDKVIYNFSDYKLTESEKSVLCKGLEFAIPPSKLEYADFMLPFELLFRDIKNSDLSIPQTKAVKSKILDTAFSSFDSFNNNKMRSNLSKEELKGLHNLRKQKHLVIQKADKGNTVVITEKNAYINRMKEIISDTTKFEQINIEQDKQLNILLKSEKKVIDLIKRLENEGKISEKEYELIYPRGSRPGVLYGSPKVHKPVINNCPKFRPILSTIGTPTYKLAKFLVPILSPLTSNEFSVHDSFSFAGKVFSFCPDHFMASLDIESLFTNIPLNEVIDICIYDLFCDTNTIQNLDRNDMRELLNLAAYESFFIFDQVMYRQIDGVAMGSPLGPILANAFLCHFEKQWLSECPPDFLPKVFKRYVDDIFVMFLCQSHLKDFVNYMNTKHPNIKFTSEFEQNDFFSFLDVKITRSNN